MNSQLYQEDIAHAREIPGIERLYGKSFLVTGATGLIGHHLIDVLLSLPVGTVVAVGRNRVKAESLLSVHFTDPRFRFIEQDVQQPFPDTLHVDYIVVGASATHPLAYAQYPIETIWTNLYGVQHALDLAESTGAEVLFESSGEIYGTSLESKPFCESDTGQLNLSTARSCYNESKRVSESLCQSYIAKRGVHVKILRFSRVFGPTMLLSDSKASSQFIMNALRGEDIVLKSEGRQYFSYCHVTDAVRGLLTVLLRGRVGEAYNVAAGACTLRYLAEVCAEACGSKVVFSLPSQQELFGISTVQYSELNFEKLQSLGFHPLYTIAQGLLRTIDVLKTSFSVSQ